MADTKTKAVAFRIPLDDYAKLLREAQENKMTLADLVISKIYSNPTLGLNTPEKESEPDSYLVDISGYDHLKNSTRAQLQEALIESWGRENSSNKRERELEELIKRLESLKVPKKKRNE
jgi:hypothetical protein